MFWFDSLQQRILEFSNIFIISSSEHEEVFFGFAD